MPTRQIKATASSRGQGIWSPRFTLCPAARKTSCSVGSLAAYQALELLVRTRIGATATTGEQMTLTVNVEGTGLSPAEATITTMVGQATPSPTPAPIPTSALPAVALPVLPVLPGATVTPGGLSTIFPVVTPTPDSRPQRHRKSASVAPAASTLPLDPRLIGGQLVGLAVLAAAITMVVARLSLRTPSPSGASASQGPGDHDTDADSSPAG